MLTNISIGSAGIGFNSLWPGDSPLFCSSTVSSVWNSSCFQELMTGRIYSEGWCLACSSLWATVSPSRKLSCSCIRWPLRKTVLEYGCVCLHVFFPQLGETTAQKHQAFFTILVKGKPVLKSNTHLILPFPTSCRECHPSWPLILYFNVKKYDSTLLSLSHFII